METSMETSRPPPVEAVVVMDRFVSASSAQDAIASLEHIVGAFKNSTKSDPNENEQELIWHPSWIFEHEELAEHLVWLLQHGTLKVNEIPCEEGVHLICQLYQYLIRSSEALTKPSPGALLGSMLDILDSSEHAVYVRVLALQVLEDLSRRHKSIAVNQWLQAPNGLYRIADLLAIDVDNNPMEEAIRNQALIVAKSLAREAPMAKVFLFAEVDCKLLDLCWKEGGLTKGSPIVIDALELIQEVLKHADASLQDLVWQRPNVAPRLVQLLDLRGGEEFLHPTKNSIQKSSKNDEADDDLDSLLASGDDKPNGKEQTKDCIIPHLMPSEETVVKLVLNILRSILDTDSIRETVWTQQPDLCSIIWDLALISSPSDPPVCALPTPLLQQEALNLVADKFNDPITMDRLSGLDRLLYLVCTGGGISRTFSEKLGISQSALAILRQTLSGDRVHGILMRTLAPPPTEDENAPPPGPTVVQKLWNTVQENLRAEASEERTLFLSGALGGLGLMLYDEQSREIMFKVTPIGLDEILECLSDERESFVKCSLLRILCEWIYECPFIAHNLLSSTASTSLAEMSAFPSDYQSLAHLLLGLAMEYLTKEEECGGWTRSGILQIITKIGISKYTSSLEGLKTTTNQKMPWVVSEMEYKNWRIFCRQAVLIIRKRVVEELASGSGDSDDEIEDILIAPGSETDIQPSSQGIKPLQRLISRQAKEIEEMTRRLETSEAKVASQEHQLTTWKRRIESTPTELDHMLNEFTSKNSDLEEKVRSLSSEIERQKLEKDLEIKTTQDELLKFQVESDLLRSQEREVRDDLERTEQEMRALSQAYTALEEEFQRQQADNSDAKTTEASRQLQGEASHEKNRIGSTEITTLRSENTRLKNDAQKADEWMSMAVQKLNEMGTANVELEKQVSLLTDKLEKSHTIVGKEQSLLSELESEKTLRQSAEERLLHFKDIQIKLEHEQQSTEHLQHRINETEQMLSKYENMESEMARKQQHIEELEKYVCDAEEATRVTTANLELEREAKIELERQLNTAKTSIDQSLPSQNEANNGQLEKVCADYDKIVASKNAEIDALRLSLQKKEEFENEGANTGAVDLANDSQVVNEMRKSSQEKIYQLESVIRELKDRLGSNLGTYKIEDILARDEEIEELRKANESAQEWMGNAVEHINKNSNQIQKLSDENASLLVQLERERTRESLGNTKNLPLMNDGEVTKQHESKLTNRKISALEAELKVLKQEKDSHQGLLDELGIAMDDVAVMQNQLSEYKTIVSELERKLSDDVLNKENVELRSSNEDLQDRLKEFEAWTKLAQTKIGDIMAAKDVIESKLQEVTEEAHNLRKENDSLQSAVAESVEENRASEQLHGKIEKLESENNNLQNERSGRELQYKNLQSQHDSLLKSFTGIEEDFRALEARNNDLQKEITEERQLSTSQSIEIGDLKNRNSALLDSLEQVKKEKDCDQVAAKGTEDITKVGTIEVEAEEFGVSKEEDKNSRLNSVVEELERTKIELAAAEKALSSDEDVAREWEDRTLQLESELANVQEQMQKQETETEIAITAWQQKVNELEERCFKLEEEREEATEKNTLDDSKYNQLKQENSCPQKKLNDLETCTGQHHDDSVTELQEELKIAQNTIARDDVVRQWEERSSELELKIQSLEKELRESEAESNEAISLWQENCAAVQQKYMDIEGELNSLKAKNQSQDIYSGSGRDEANYNGMEDLLAERETEIRRLNEEVESRDCSLQQLKDEVQALNKQIGSLSDKLVNQKAEAMKSVEQWEQRLSASEEEKCQLKNDIEESKSHTIQLEDLRRNLANSDQLAVEWEMKTTELSETVGLLENQLKEQEQEALDAVEQWQSACSDLEIKCANLELVNKDRQEMTVARGWSIEQLTSCNETYREQIEKLKVASRKIESSLQENLVRAETEVLRIKDAHGVECKKRDEDKLILQAAFDLEKERNREASDQIETLTTSLEETKAEADDISHQWTARYDELKTALKDAQKHLEEQESEANDAILIWEMKTNDLEKELDVVEDQLLQLQDMLKVEGAEAQVSVVVATKNLLDENVNLNAEMENTKGVVDEMKSQTRCLERENNALKDSLSTSDKKFQEMKIKHDEMVHELALKSEDKLEGERDRLIGLVAQLEEELREANSMLQACITDGSTIEASQFAANAIRDDIFNMRNQLNEYQQKFEDEKAARKVADLETERLRNDMAALLSLSDHEKSPTNLKKLATKSIEKLQKLEHSEIDDLRKSLFRALEELEYTRSAEKTSNETISKLRLQISIYEQEIVAAKSEVNFLGEAMEELRQTEDSKRASLEYRIGSLENENVVVRKYQSNELESLRNELAQITMERDVVAHQLKETEKSNASLVLAASKEKNSDREQNSNIQFECTKLRIENAHLLSIAAEDKGKTERRFRELLTAQVANSELDLILEHELRLSAETALQSLKEEMKDIQNSKCAIETQMSGEKLTEKELHDLRTTLENVKEQNRKLKVAMNKEASKAKQMIDLLTEQCQKAQAKAFRSDRDTRAELAVQSEMSKMKLANMSLPSDKFVLNEGFIHGTRDVPSTSNSDLNLHSAEAFDLIRKQQKEIQEERMMYNETLQEHEDLLALVAQQDLEKTCLREALIEVAGDDVANDAIRKAEEFAVIRYGNAVRVSN